MNGHNISEMAETIAGLDLQCGKPHVLLARTVKGKGVSFIEDRAAWHHKIPVDDQVVKAIRELE